jgi:hypothetical protein
VSGLVCTRIASRARANVEILYAGTRQRVGIVLLDVYELRHIVFDAFRCRGSGAKCPASGCQVERRNERRLLLMPARDQLEAVQITSYLVTLGFLTQCLALFAYLPYFRFHCHSCNSRLKSPLGAIRVSNAICWMMGVLDDGKQETGNGHALKR